MKHDVMRNFGTGVGFPEFGTESKQGTRTFWRCKKCGVILGERVENYIHIDNNHVIVSGIPIMPSVFRVCRGSRVNAECRQTNYLPLAWLTEASLNAEKFKLIPEMQVSPIDGKDVGVPLGSAGVLTPA